MFELEWNEFKIKWQKSLEGHHTKWWIDEKQKTTKKDMIQLFIVRGKSFVYDDKIGYSNLQNEMILDARGIQSSWNLTETDKFGLW